jgi:hemoglobin-like flavoprotein
MRITGWLIGALAVFSIVVSGSAQNQEPSIEAEVRASFERSEAAGDFADKFYAIFLNKSPEIALLFAQTDFERQRRLLRTTVYIMVTQDLDDPTARETLERIGRSHGRSELNIRPELYDLWLDSICETVKDLDPEWTPETERFWRERMAPGIALITSLY